MHKKPALTPREIEFIDRLKDGGSLRYLRANKTYVFEQAAVSNTVSKSLVMGLIEKGIFSSLKTDTGITLTLSKIFID